jgi:protein-tyrosine phosphatase
MCIARPGYRSPTVVVAYLIKHRGMDLDAAIRYVQGCKRDAFFYEHHFMGVLSDFYRSVKA